MLIQILGIYYLGDQWSFLSKNDKQGYFTLESLKKRTNKTILCNKEVKIVNYF